ncbi:hypothetical protein CFN78_16210 [Amycolatopsis antarctica]|uniref:ChsH2 rubredoxin-like zinc ribbon domain-containing protein n=1 Tax=Amycolatopsis antarctica TaxID=1854586 RepID=A0A263D1Y4_9PSEU|nr:zinc ribbon domain-containing protein [Amycolatopsis antarctica]OZM72088.1 hypothetical protein CFN78_16210 [Amycolatopsis antarctica]
MPTVGIESVGSYVPGYRLAGSLAAELGGAADLPLCAPDEDALTLSAEALRTLPGSAPRDRVALRTTSGAEPRAALAHLAATGGVDDPCVVLPLAAESGAPALLAMAAGLRAQIAVVADHGRPADPAASPAPDGAVALRFGSPDAAAILHSESLHTLAFDRWTDGSTEDPEDPRFIEETLLASDGTELLDCLCAGAGVTPGDLAGVVLNCVVPVRADRWAERWKVSRVWTPGPPERQAGRLAAATLRTTFERLADAGPGALVAVLDLAWGGDAVLLRAGDRVADTVHVTRRPATAEYGYRDWLRSATPSGQGIWTSPAKLRREVPGLLRLTGSRCTACECVTFPGAATCEMCGAAEVAAHPLARHGTVLSHNVDRLFAAPEREVQMIVVELDGGGRFFGQSVAAPRRWASVGDTVRLSLRRLHSGGGRPHYFWKVDLDD